MHVIRRILLFALLLLLPALAFAQPKITPPTGRFPLMPKAAPGRERFPSDFKPSACAPPNGCVSFSPVEFPSAAFRFLGLSLSGAWVSRHSEAMIERFQPMCAKVATCLATPNNSFAFCTDIAAPEFRKVCDELHPKAKDPRDFDQCQFFVETYALGVDQHAQKLWQTAEACAAKQNVSPVHDKPLEVWMTPETLTPDYTGYLTIFAVDPDTKVPVPATIYIDGNGIYAPANPNGLAQAYYPFKWPMKFRRVPNATGHTDLSRPIVTLRAPGYPELNYELDLEMAQVALDMTPKVSQFKNGDNTITVTARDVKSGKPVEMRVNFGEVPVGETNKPFVWKKVRGQKVPQIWVTSLFGRYSDVEVAPAQR
jgi:hypothetical protein